MGKIFVLEEICKFRHTIEKRMDSSQMGIEKEMIRKLCDADTCRLGGVEALFRRNVSIETTMRKYSEFIEQWERYS